jgi:hypothetical protein
MNAEGWMRASDEDRQIVVDVLRQAHAVGRLRPDEFYERMDAAAYAAVTWGDLDGLTADLPVVWTDAGLPSDAGTLARGSRAGGWHLYYRTVLMCLLALILAPMVYAASVALWTVCVLVLLIAFVVLLLR